MALMANPVAQVLGGLHPHGQPQSLAMLLAALHGGSHEHVAGFGGGPHPAPPLERAHGNLSGYGQRAHGDLSGYGHDFNAFGGGPHPPPVMPPAGIHYFGAGGGGVAYPSGGPSGELRGSRGLGYMEPIRRRSALSEAFRAA